MINPLPKVGNREGPEEKLTRPDLADHLLSYALFYGEENERTK